MLKKCALIAALMLVIGPASARADWLFTPNIGIGFGGDTPSNDKLTYGASLGWMGAGIAGFEAGNARTHPAKRSPVGELVVRRRVAAETNADIRCK